MRKRFIIGLIGICACLFSGCGIDSAMSELAARQLLSANGTEEENTITEEAMPETEPSIDSSVALTPQTTLKPPSDGFDFGAESGNSSEEADEETYDEEIYEKNTAEESDETDWYYEEAEYIFPNSDTQKLTEDDLAGMSSEELRLGRNEIYARHGRCFDDWELQSYFNGQSWYLGSIAPSDFVDSLELNHIERWNAKFIRKHE